MDGPAGRRTQAWHNPPRAARGRTRAPPGSEGGVDGGEQQRGVHGAAVRAPGGLGGRSERGEDGRLMVEA